MVDSILQLSDKNSPIHFGGLSRILTPFSLGVEASKHGLQKRDFVQKKFRK